MTCPDCGKKGITYLAKHKRFCKGKKAKKATASPAKKKTPPVPMPPPHLTPKPTPPPAPKQPANIAAEASEGLRFAALLRKKAADHRAKAGQLEDMAKAAESLL